MRMEDFKFDIGNLNFFIFFWLVIGFIEVYLKLGRDIIFSWMSFIYFVECYNMWLVCNVCEDCSFLFVGF